MSSLVRTIDDQMDRPASLDCDPSICAWIRARITTRSSPISASRGRSIPWTSRNWRAISSTWTVAWLSPPLRTGAQPVPLPACGWSRPERYVRDHGQLWPENSDSRYARGGFARQSRPPGASPSFRTSNRGSLGPAAAGAEQHLRPAVLRLEDQPRGQPLACATSSSRAAAASCVCFWPSQRPTSAHGVTIWPCACRTSTATRRPWDSTHYGLRILSFGRARGLPRTTPCTSKTAAAGVPTLGD